VIAVDYKKELKKMKKRRKRYLPVMASLMNMHLHMNKADFPFKITDPDEIRTIIELMDIGYCDADVLTVERRFEDITGLTYNGKFPLTDKGEFFFRHKGGASHPVDF
jgi:hypothetical protein